MRNNIISWSGLDVRLGHRLSDVQEDCEKHFSMLKCFFGCFSYPVKLFDFRIVIKEVELMKNMYFSLSSLSRFHISFSNSLDKIGSSASGR